MILASFTSLVTATERLKFMSNNHSKHHLAFLSMGLALLVGCGGSGLGTIPVSGKITVDGQPMEGVMVVFNPGDGGRAAAGRTDAQGIYKLTTEIAGDGALPGSYKVAVSKHENAADDVPTNVDPNDPASLDAVYSKVDARKKQVSTSFIADMYGNPMGSGLTAEVKSGGENKFDFDVKGNPKAKKK